jgi:excisionase family DNA binding protein
MLTVKAVAKELGVSTRTVHRYIKQGKIKVVKLSERMTRITEEELKRIKGL